MKRVFIWVIISLLLAGCYQTQYAIKDDVYERLKEAPPPPPPATSPGSLWKGESNRNMLFSDNKAMYQGDIITIVVNETSSAKNDASTNTSRATSTEAKISALLGLDTSILKRNANMGTEIAAGGTTTSTMKGSGDTNRGNTLKMNIAGRVVKVLENGNLLIEGRKQVTINDEDQYIVITGIIRPQDVTPDNTVDSKNIADARIIYTGAGVVTDKQRPGWGTRILDWIWPF